MVTTPENTCLFVKASGGVMLPVVNSRCFHCDQVVDVTTGPSGEDADWYISRVNGDSKYGYELYHMACPEALAKQAEWEAMEVSEAPTLRLV